MGAAPCSVFLQRGVLALQSRHGLGVRASFFRDSRTLEPEK
jgi:hypothetical protein